MDADGKKVAPAVNLKSSWVDELAMTSGELNKREWVNG